MSKSYPKPEYVIELARRLEQKYQDRNLMYDEIHRRRFMKHQPQIPVQYQKTAVKALSASIYETIRRSVAIIAAALPVAKVVPVKSGADAQANSSKREKWLGAAFRRMETDNPVYPRMLDGVAYGEGVIKLLLKQKEWGALQREDDEDAGDFLDRADRYHRAHFPFAWEHVDSRTFYPLYDADGLCEVLEVTSREALPLQRQYGLSPDGQSGLKKIPYRGPGAQEGTYLGEVKFYEYWNRDTWMRVVQGGEVVERGQHPYGRPPYFMAHAATTSSRRPEEEHPSLVYGLVHAQDILDSLKTIRLNWAYFTGFPVFVFEAKSIDDVIPLNPDQVIEIIQGKAVSPPPGYTLKTLQFPPVGPELQSMYEEAKRDLDSLSLAPILQGTLPGSDVSGTAAMAMIAVAKSIFAPATESVVRMFDDMGAFMQERIEKDLKEPVPVWMVDSKGAGTWFELGPKDIDGYYEVRHSLHPVLPAERYQKSLWMGDAYARGLVDANMVREEGYGFEAPEEIEERVIVENIMKMPQILNLIMQKVIEQVVGQPQQINAPGTPPGMPAAMGGPGAPVIPGIGRPTEAAAMMAQQGVPVAPQG